MQLKKLHEEKAKLVYERNKLSDRISTIKNKIDEIEFGCKLDDTIDYEGKKYIISKFELFWLKGYLIKKDGTKSINDYHLYDIKRKFRCN